ncbi:MAG TPA: hypothetical protein VF458_00620 [Ktedonobacteraceae bacterium]
MSQEKKPSSSWSGWVWGDHHYEVPSVPMCNTNTDEGCSLKLVYECMVSNRSFVTPTNETGPVVNEGTTTIPYLGTVEHTVNQEDFSVTNTTRPDHLLDPGTVVRQVQEMPNGDVIVLTTGDGSGLVPGANVALSSFVWGGPNEKLHQEVQENLDKKDKK